MVLGRRDLDAGWVALRVGGLYQTAGLRQAKRTPPKTNPQPAATQLHSYGVLWREYALAVVGRGDVQVGGLGGGEAPEARVAKVGRAVAAAHGRAGLGVRVEQHATARACKVQRPPDLLQASPPHPKVQEVQRPPGLGAAGDEPIQGDWPVAPGSGGRGGGNGGAAEPRLPRMGSELCPAQGPEPG